MSLVVNSQNTEIRRPFVASQTLMHFGCAVMKV